MDKFWGFCNQLYFSRQPMNSVQKHPGWALPHNAKNSFAQDDYLLDFIGITELQMLQSLSREMSN